jgi:hypothetical protein
LLALVAVAIAMPTEGEKGDLAELEHDMDGQEVLLKLWLKKLAKKEHKGKVAYAPAPVYAAPVYAPPPPVYAAPAVVPVKVKKFKG